MRGTSDDLRDIAATNAAFVAQAQAFELRYRCEHCAHVTPSAGSCSLGYPNPSLTGPAQALTADGALTFCKFFELGEQ